MMLRRRIWSSSAALALILGPISWAGAAEPRVFDLAIMAPVLDAQQPDCHSLDIEGVIGSGKADGPNLRFVALRGDPHDFGVIGEDKEPGPRLRFRAIYREPDQFCLLVTDAQSGTPLVYSSGRTMVFYDPVEPAIYYSEASGFRMEMTVDQSVMKFGFDYFLKSSGRPRIRIDLQSVLANELAQTQTEPVVRPTRGNPKQWILDFKAGDAPSMYFQIDPSKSSKYTHAEFFWDGCSVLRFDRLERNGSVDPDVFRFPSKERLAHDFPIKFVTATTSTQDWNDLSMKVGLAGAVRSLASREDPLASAKAMKLPDLDWARIHENDRKYRDSLLEIIPPSLRDPRLATSR